MRVDVQLHRSHRTRTSLLCGVVATVLVGSLCTIILAGNFQQELGGPQAVLEGGLRGRHLLQETAASKAHRQKLVHIHGWLMCLAWGFLAPFGIVIACFRTVRGMGAWWFHLHRALLLLGFLASLAGLSVGVYLDPGRGGLVWQHKIIGIAVNMAALIQVVAGIAMKPPKTSYLRRAWNLTHWTLGRAGLALGIADIFFGMYLSSVAYKNIIAQAVVLGGLFIIVMLKNDIEYLLVEITPAQEEERLRAAKLSGASKSLGMTNIQKSSNSPGYGSALVNNSNGLAPAHGAGSRLQTIV